MASLSAPLLLLERLRGHHFSLKLQRSGYDVFKIEARLCDAECSFGLLYLSRAALRLIGRLGHCDCIKVWDLSVLQSTGEPFELRVNGCATLKKR